jgi:hypothetical protein
MDTGEGYAHYSIHSFSFVLTFGTGWYRLVLEMLATAQGRHRCMAGRP